MSTQDYYLLHLEKTAWQLHGPAASSESTQPKHTFSEGALGEQAPRIIEALTEGGQLGKPLVLGLDANWCLAATIDVSSPKMLRKPQLLHYQLEESIPWSAEEYVSDFFGHRNQAFSVAVRHQELAGLLKMLAAEGIVILAVVPTTLLAVADHLNEENLADQVLLWQEGNDVDVVTIRQEQPWRWSRVPADPTEITRHIQLEQLSNTTTATLFSRGLSVKIGAALAQIELEVQELPAVEQCEAASRTSQAILAGQHEPSINLCQGELGGEHHYQVLSKELGRLKIAFALLLISMGAWFGLRSGQYQEESAEVRTQLTKTYKELFPNSKEVPLQVGAALDKEHRQLHGTRAPDSELPHPIAVDLVLEKMLQHLPSNLRFRLPEIRIEQQRLTLGGEVRSNADADKIAAALRSHGFTVDPPRTQRLSDKGFGVRLQAEVVQDKEKDHHE